MPNVIGAPFRGCLDGGASLTSGRAKCQWHFRLCMQRHIRQRMWRCGLVAEVGLLWEWLNPRGPAQAAFQSGAARFTFELFC